MNDDGSAYAVYIDGRTVTVLRSDGSQGTFETLAATAYAAPLESVSTASDSSGTMYLLFGLDGSSAEFGGALLTVQANGTVAWSAAPSRGFIAVSPSGADRLIVGGEIYESAWVSSGASWVALATPPTISGTDAALGAPVSGSASDTWWIPESMTDGTVSTTRILSLTSDDQWIAAEGLLSGPALAYGQADTTALQADGPWYAESEQGLGILRSSDFGATWQTIDSNLPAAPESLIAVGPDDLLAVLNNENCVSKSSSCDMQVGTWASTDGAVSWIPAPAETKS